MARVERIEETDGNVEAPRPLFARVPKLDEQSVAFGERDVGERRSARASIAKNDDAPCKDTCDVFPRTADLRRRHTPVAIAVEARHERYAIGHGERQSDGYATIRGPVLARRDAQRMRARFPRCKYRENKYIWKSAYPARGDQLGPKFDPKPNP